MFTCTLFWWVQKNNNASDLQPYILMERTSNKGLWSSVSNHFSFYQVRKWKHCKSLYRSSCGNVCITNLRCWCLMTWRQLLVLEGLLRDNQQLKTATTILGNNKRFLFALCNHSTSTNSQLFTLWPSSTTGDMIITAKMLFWNSVLMCRFSWLQLLRLWTSGLWCHVIWQGVINTFNKHSSTFFRL